MAFLTVIRRARYLKRFDVFECKDGWGKPFGFTARSARARSAIKIFGSQRNECHQRH
jgi:hypothetical protein